MATETTCTHHCAACQGHFHSEGAFAAHRAGGTCLEPLDEPRFVALTTTGKCELQRTEYTPLEPGNRQRFPAGWQPGDPPMQRVAAPVTVWTLEISDKQRAGLARAAAQRRNALRVGQETG